MDEQIELSICAKTQHEGFGSVYERIRLGRLLGRLQEKYEFHTVLEYGCPFTKGYDNLVFLARGCQVSVLDPGASDLAAEWPFEETPPGYVCSLEEGKTFDLVWNFAVLQLGEVCLTDLARVSLGFVLVFTPNILNYGTPFHIGYHILSLTKCQHPERGLVRIRTRLGLVRSARRHGLEVLESGYVDIPWWPDTAFSIREFKKNVLRMKKVDDSRKAGTVAVREPEAVLRDIEAASWMEDKNLVHPFFAHHTYIFAKLR